MEKQKAFLNITEMLQYFQCGSGARCVLEGKEVVNAGLCIT